MKTLTEQIKKIKSQYDFPIWLIKETLEYHNGDEDKAFDELRKIYSAVGDHPDVVIEKNIEKFMDKIRYSKSNKAEVTGWQKQNLLFAKWLMRQYDEIERIPYEYWKNAFITIKVIALMCDHQKKMMYYKAQNKGVTGC